MNICRFSFVVLYIFKEMYKLIVVWKRSGGCTFSSDFADAKVFEGIIGCV